MTKKNFTTKQPGVSCPNEAWEDLDRAMEKAGILGAVSFLGILAFGEGESFESVHHRLETKEGDPYPWGNEALLEIIFTQMCRWAGEIWSLTNEWLPPSPYYLKMVAERATKEASEGGE